MADGSFNFAKCTNNQCTEHVPGIWLTDDKIAAIKNDADNSVFECRCPNVLQVLNSKLFKQLGEWDVKYDGEFGERDYTPITNGDSDGKQSA